MANQFSHLASPMIRANMRKAQKRLKARKAAGRKPALKTIHGQPARITRNKSKTKPASILGTRSGGSIY